MEKLKLEMNKPNQLQSSEMGLRIGMRISDYHVDIQYPSIKCVHAHQPISQISDDEMAAC